MIDTKAISEMIATLVSVMRKEGVLELEANSNDGNIKLTLAPTVPEIKPIVAKPVVARPDPNLEYEEMIKLALYSVNGDAPIPPEFKRKP